MIPGVILAAGASSRMGRPKALLTLPDGSTFVQHLTASLIEGGVADVLIVGRPEDQPLRTEVESLAGARFVENARADEGQLSSVIAGVNAADRPGVAGVLITPVDLPLIKASTIRTLLASYSKAHAPIARTMYRGRHGHPAVFSRMVFDELRHADPAVGAKAVIHSRQTSVINVEVDDPAVLRDVDTPDDYARLTESSS